MIPANKFVRNTTKIKTMHLLGYDLSHKGDTKNYSIHKSNHCSVILDTSLMPRCSDNCHSLDIMQSILPR